MSAFAVKDGDYVVFIHSGIKEALWLENEFTKLGAKRQQWSKGYSAVEHSPHSPVGQHHVHVFLKGDKCLL